MHTINIIRLTRDRRAEETWQDEQLAGGTRVRGLRAGGAGAGAIAGVGLLSM